MRPRQVVLYIAASLDGYIADPYGDISFLARVETPGEDYGYGEFIKTVDTVIMGRKTYEKVLSLGTGFPHHDKKCYVVSRTRTGQDRNVEFFHGDVGELVASLRGKEGRDIFIDGGSELVHELIVRNLIDTYVVSVLPVLLGAGIPLFKPGRSMLNLELRRCIPFPSGLVQLWYGKQ